MSEKQKRAVAAVQLDGAVAEQHGGAVVGSMRAEEQGGAVSVGAAVQGGAAPVRRRVRWGKQEGKALVLISKEMKQHLRRLDWNEVAGRVRDFKNSSSWRSGPTPDGSAQECRKKYYALLRYSKSRHNGKFAVAGEEMDAVAEEDTAVDAAAAGEDANGEDVQGPPGAGAVARDKGFDLNVVPDFND